MCLFCLIQSEERERAKKASGKYPQVYKWEMVKYIINNNSDNRNLCSHKKANMSARIAVYGRYYYYSLFFR